MRRVAWRSATDCSTLAAPGFVPGVPQTDTFCFLPETKKQGRHPDRGIHLKTERCLKVLVSFFSLLFLSATKHSRGTSWSSYSRAWPRHTPGSPFSSRPAALQTLGSESASRAVLHCNWHLLNCPDLRGQMNVSFRKAASPPFLLLLTDSGGT